MLGEEQKFLPQTSSEAILQPNAADPKDCGFLQKGESDLFQGTILL
jgi:hypothetical protein